MTIVGAAKNVLNLFYILSTLYFYQFTNNENKVSKLSLQKKKAEKLNKESRQNWAKNAGLMEIKLIEDG